ncbi:hypothetical protein MKZ38_006497 [Zalerion maritima]|uniref:Uncharacterized protein n=1 Tax=Zalerion maritima TaxID=339359 RepID=A0AAD5RZ13_9PEZI|nr:hypothetical protein MKZ38_006497 [Zalerion maritima]
MQPYTRPHPRPRTGNPGSSPSSTPNLSELPLGSNNRGSAPPPPNPNPNPNTSSNPSPDAKPNFYPSSTPNHPPVRISGQFQHHTFTLPKHITVENLPPSVGLVSGVSHHPHRLRGRRNSCVESQVHRHKLGRDLLVYEKTSFYSPRQHGQQQRRNFLPIEHDEREEWEKLERFRPMGPLGFAGWMWDEGLEKVKFGMRQRTTGELKCVRCEVGGMGCSLTSVVAERRTKRKGGEGNGKGGKEGEEGVVDGEGKNAEKLRGKCARCIRNGEEYCVRRGFVDPARQARFSREAGANTSGCLLGGANEVVVYQADGLAPEKAREAAEEIIGRDSVSTGGIAYDGSPKISKTEAKRKTLPTWWRLPSRDEVFKIPDLKPDEMDSLKALARWKEYQTRRQIQGLGFELGRRPPEYGEFADHASSAYGTSTETEASNGSGSRSRSRSRSSGNTSVTYSGSDAVDILPSSTINPVLYDRARQFDDEYRHSDFLSSQYTKDKTRRIGKGKYIVPGAYLLTDKQLAEAYLAARIDRMHVLGNILHPAGAGMAGDEDVSDLERELREIDTAEMIKAEVLDRYWKSWGREMASQKSEHSSDFSS